jgi:hypothetical protein
MRQYLRHPAEIPIELLRADGESPDVEPLKDVSLNGLSFNTATPVSPGATLRVRIPLVEPAFEAQVRVVWCRACKGRFDLGVELTDAKDAFRARMVEQICRIEEYRKEVRAREGRELTAEQAAMEWIEKFAEDFPAPPPKRGP